MRTNTISNLAFLASSLLVKDVIAGVVHNHARLHQKRDSYMIMVEEEVQISRGADGSFHTGRPVPVRTTTVLVKPSATPVADAAPAPASSSSVAPVVVPSSSPAAASVEQVKAAAASHVVEPEPTTTAVAPVVPTPAATTPATSVVRAAPTTLATSAAPASTAASTPVSSGGKRGVAFNDNSVLSVFSGKASWCYNWGQSEGTIPSGFEYVPMLWGNKAGFYDSWASNANSAISSGSTHLLAFNEPDLSAQSNMGVSTAVADYKTHMQPFAGKAKLGAPSVTNGGAPMGLTYLKNFVDSCSGCTIDFVPIHWYNGDALDSSISYFKTHVAEAHTAGGNKPVWITEFQYLGTDEAGFLAEIIPWLESQDFVERYSYFMASDGRLISGTALSAVGKAYIA
ncbi:(Trans)glycosidase [Glarea lozoyensis ATCC 20868]|uniref:(Trans)glycosidase n=2 Tax=Glarea lozoyensis TaxID=101852 RepID=S3EE89_GLAL2|nr:(Trans)glycosidase [Glarea lozoyensis ATCC 20868]EHK99282.1 putative Uncharacterized serine-rich protein C13G6.10c [Glarea lozoyensis 74030]EPE36578.1 (Trans)glycosidase [Glarea lozoyensis ATCC 20868]